VIDQSRQWLKKELGKDREGKKASRGGSNTMPFLRDGKWSFDRCPSPLCVDPTLFLNEPLLSNCGC